MTIDLNSVEEDHLSLNRSDSDPSMPAIVSFDPAIRRLLSEAARSAASAYDEVFDLKRELASINARLAHALAAEQTAIASEREAKNKALQAARSLERAQKELTVQRTRADYFEEVCRKIQTSSSWRITAAFRAMTRLLRS